MLVISYLGQTYKFTKTDSTENEYMFRDRCWWIVKNIDKSQNIDDLVALSHIWVSVKYLGCSYEEHVMELINTFNSVYIEK